MTGFFRPARLLAALGLGSVLTLSGMPAQPAFANLEYPNYYRCWETMQWYNSGGGRSVAQCRSTGGGRYEIYFVERRSGRWVEVP